MGSSPKPLVVIVEDEKEIASLISEQLEAVGMLTQVYNRPNLALKFLSHNFANLMLLDVHLPDQSGFEFMEELKRKDIEVPVIFLTASDSEMNKVRGLELGGDDYIVKPFSFPELIARINAVLRRAETAKDLHVTQNASLSQEPFDFCGATVYPLKMEIVFPNNVTEKIGKKELGIMQFLTSNPDNVLTRRSLIHAVWGMHADVKSRSLDQYVVKIRDLLKSNGALTENFKTIHGVGYLYESLKPAS